MSKLGGSVELRAHEVYAAGDASFEMLYLSYVIREMQNIPFPSPMTLEMDNSAAEVFAKNSSWKSRLKHIDKALDWVRCLRDPGILIATHVPTAENLSDIFTKILDKSTFQRLASQRRAAAPGSRRRS